MTSPLDEQLSAALNAEAERSPDHASAADWPAIERRVARTRRTRRALTAAAAAIVVVAAAVQIVGPLDDDGARVEIQDEPDRPAEAPVPDGRADPIGDQPGPAPRRDAPPETVVALTADDRLVVVDTATGEESRELTNHDAPHPDFPGLGPDALLHVQLSPDGKTAWYDTCCSVGGLVYRVPVDGSAPPQVAANGYEPTFASSSAWVATVSDNDVYLNFPAGDWSRYWHDVSQSGGLQEVAWSLDGSAVVARLSSAERDLETGALLALDPSLMGDLDASDAVEHDHQEPRVLPGESWKLPVFRRDGKLVAARRAADGQWHRDVFDVDADSGEPLESTPLGGEPLDQDFDASGEWLLTVVREPGDDAGTPRWTGPDGQTGSVPGRYFSAAW